MKLYLFFDKVDRPVGIVTDRWRVCKRSDGSVLGGIQWDGRWRQYVFFPVEETIWSAGCLAEVSGFITAKMEERRAGR